MFGQELQTAGYVTTQTNSLGNVLRVVAASRRDRHMPKARRDYGNMFQ